MQPNGLADSGQGSSVHGGDREGDGGLQQRVPSADHRRGPPAWPARSHEQVCDQFMNEPYHAQLRYNTWDSLVSSLRGKVSREVSQRVRAESRVGAETNARLNSSNSNSTHYVESVYYSTIPGRVGTDAPGIRRAQLSVPWQLAGAAGRDGQKRRRDHTE